MDNVKLGDKSKIEILDPTHVNQASHTINLRKELEMYKNMTKKQFNKEVEELSSKERERASLYIAKAMNAFVKDDKTSIKILYFFK
jgi:ribosomal protein L21E